MIQVGILSEKQPLKKKNNKKKEKSFILKINVTQVK